MARPQKPRRIKFRPGTTYFKPRAISLRELKEVSLEPGEIEAIRLCDLEKKSQVEAAKKMKVSQSTLSRILISAHQKIAEALIEGKAIRIEK